MKKSDREKIRSSALKANQKDWEPYTYTDYDPNGPDFCFAACSHSYQAEYSEIGRFAYSEQAQNDAEHIFNTQPKVILELLSYIDELEFNLKLERKLNE